MHRFVVVFAIALAGCSGTSYTISHSVSSASSTEITVAPDGEQQRSAAQVDVQDMPGAVVGGRAYTFVVHAGIPVTVTSLHGQLSLGGDPASVLSLDGGPHYVVQYTLPASADSDTITVAGKAPGTGSVWRFPVVRVP